MEDFGEVGLGEDEARGGVVSFSGTVVIVFGDTGDGEGGEGTSVMYFTIWEEILCHSVIFSR